MFGAALGMWWVQPGHLTETKVQRAVITTIQSEAPASFLVTGTLTITATTTVRNTRYLFPNLFRLDMGTTEARVRLPGRVAYGFDVTTLQPEDIQVGGDGVIDVAVPDLDVFSVEPNLEAMEVETEVGWARTHAHSGRQTTQQALTFAHEALREQGTTYLAESTQPRLHTAEALQRMLTPVLEAAGHPAPRFRFHIGRHLVMEPKG